MPHIDAEPEALSADGQGLQHCTPGAAAGTGCAPAGLDPVSTAVAASFSVWESGLEALLTHSQALRVAGGLAVSHTAAILDGTDQAGGTTIASLAKAPAPSPDATLPEGNVPSLPTLPDAPAVPAVPEPISGDAWSEQIHSGPGVAPLREYASRMRVRSADLTTEAEQIRSHGQGIDAHWDDGIQKAGANVSRLADWFDGAATYATDVAAAADRCADHVSQAVSGTPRPETFAQLQARVDNGLQRFNRSGGLDAAPLQGATTDMAEAQRQAIDEQVTYAAAANSTTVDVPAPPKPAPPIVGPPSPDGGGKPDSSPAIDGDDAAKTKMKKIREDADGGANDAGSGGGDPTPEGGADPAVQSAAANPPTVGPWFPRPAHPASYRPQSVVGTCGRHRQHGGPDSQRADPGRRRNVARPRRR